LFKNSRSPKKNAHLRKNSKIQIPETSFHKIPCHKKKPKIQKIRKKIKKIKKKSKKNKKIKEIKKIKKIKNQKNSEDAPRVMYERVVRSDTRLSAVQKFSPTNSGHGAGQVHIWADDQGRLSSELEDDGGKVLGGCPHHTGQG
jgi:hypothetical protein